MIELEAIGFVQKKIDYTAGDKARVNFSIGVPTRVKVDGAWTKKTQYVQVTVFGTQAEWLGTNLRERDRIFVRGEPSFRTYDKDGAAVVAVSIVANKHELCGQSDAPSDPGAYKPKSQQAGNESNGFVDDDLLF